MFALNSIYSDQQHKNCDKNCVQIFELQSQKNLFHPFGRGGINFFQKFFFKLMNLKIFLDMVLHVVRFQVSIAHLNILKR